MLVYKGTIQQLHQEIEHHRVALERAYSALFPQSEKHRERLDALVTEDSYISINPDTTFFLDPVENPAAQIQNRLQFLSAIIAQKEELFVTELDRRVLERLGYRSDPWVRRYEEELSQDTTNEILALRRLSDDEFISLVRKWTEHAQRSNGKAVSEYPRNFITSYSSFDIRKKPLDSPEIEDAQTYAYGVTRDNYFGVIITSPKIDILQVEDTGKLTSRGTKQIKTSPFLSIQAQNFATYTPFLDDLPPFLVPFMHEFHHLLLYAIQGYPTSVAVNILYQLGRR